jgi:hypothetical protein
MLFQGSRTGFHTAEKIEQIPLDGIGPLGDDPAENRNGIQKFFSVFFVFLFNYVDLYVLGSDITKCKFDDLREEMKGYYKEFVIKNENVNSGLVNEIGDASSDFEDAKTSEEHLSDFIDLMDWDTSIKENVRKLLTETREKINL